MSRLTRTYSNKVKTHKSSSCNNGPRRALQAACEGRKAAPENASKGFGSDFGTFERALATFKSSLATFEGALATFESDFGTFERALATFESPLATFEGDFEGLESPFEGFQDRFGVSEPAPPRRN